MLTLITWFSPAVIAPSARWSADVFYRVFSKGWLFLAYIFHPKIVLLSVITFSVSLKTNQIVRK